MLYAAFFFTGTLVGGTGVYLYAKKALANLKAAATSIAAKL